MSALTLGTLYFGRPNDKAETYRILDAAIDAGVNPIDCADVTARGQSERIPGAAFRRDKKHGQVLLTSKACNTADWMY